MSVLVSLKNVVKKFDDKVVLNGISFDVSEGESVGIVGFSGCGKSTVLKIICQLEELTDGEIQINDPNISMIFQYSALFDSLTILENVAFALTEGIFKKKKQDKKELREMVLQRLRLVGLSGVEDRYPSELSGGMQKRVSFARAIITDPKIILYDEPTAGLDPVASTVIEDYINQLKSELQSASIVVTHQMSTIQRTSDRVIMLYDGNIVWTGTPSELLSSQDPYAVQFVTANRVGPMMTAAG